MNSSRIRSFATSYHRQKRRRIRQRIILSSESSDDDSHSISQYSSHFHSLTEQYCDPVTDSVDINGRINNELYIDTIIKLYSAMAIKFKISDTAAKSLYELISYISQKSIKLPDYNVYKEKINSSRVINYVMMKFNCSLQDFTNMEVESCCNHDHGSLSVFNMDESIQYILLNNHEYLINNQHDNTLKIGDFRESKRYSIIWTNHTPISSQDHAMITLLLNLDDASMVKSNNVVVTPITFTIAELPHHRRNKKCNVMTAGIWWGNHKVNHDLLWKICVTTPISEYLRGKNLVIHNRVVQVTMKIGLVIMDSVAKPKTLNCMLFNAEYGCPYCKQRCESIHDDRNKNHRVYLYDQNLNPALKTHEFYREAALIAESNGRQHFGVNGNMHLINFIDVPSQIPVDYMHACLEGVFRAMLGKIINRENNLVRSFNDHIKIIKIPHEFTRKIRPLESLTHWKAHELRFTAFYLLPIFKRKITDDHFKLFSCFVMIMRTMVQKHLSEQDIVDIQFLIGIFMESYQEIFGNWSMTFNLHLLRHLPHQIADIGNCINFSAFVYENNMYNLKQGFHGTRGQLNQISKTYCLSKTVTSYDNEIVSDLPMEFQDLISKSISETRRFIDKPVAGKIIEAQVLRILKRHHQWVTQDHVMIFPRIKLNRMVYHSMIYAYKRSSASYYFSYTSSSNQKPKFGLIEYFIGLPASSRATIITHSFVVFRKFKTYESQSIHTGSLGATNRHLRGISASPLMKNFFYKLKITDDLGVLMAEKIRNKAIILMEDNVNDICWGTEMVEDFEHD